MTPNPAFEATCAKSRAVASTPRWASQMHRLVSVLALTMFLLVRPAHGVEQLSLAKIEKSLSTFAGSIGCSFNFTKSNVTEFDVLGEGTRDRFVALFFLDPQCSGGSAMGTSMFAVLERNSSGNIYVRPELSGPVPETIGFPRFIDRIFVKGKELWFSGKEFDFSKDALCCPSVPVEGKVQLRRHTVQVESNGQASAWVWQNMGAQ